MVAVLGCCEALDSTETVKLPSLVPEAGLTLTQAWLELMLQA